MIRVDMSPTKVLMVFGSSKAGNMLGMYKPMYDELQCSGALDDGRVVVAPPVVDVTWVNLPRVIARERPHIVHVVVHGPSEFDDWNPSGVSAPISPAQWALMFKDTGVQIVVLMGSGTHDHALAIARDGGVPRVYGQSQPHAAGVAPYMRHMIEWTRGFYWMLGLARRVNDEVLVEANIAGISRIRQLNVTDNRDDVDEGAYWLTTYYGDMEIKQDDS